MWMWIDFTVKLMVEVQNFGYLGENRSRPVKVVGFVRLKKVARAAANATPLAMCGLGSAEDDRSYNTEFGHILGLAVGGTNDIENVATDVLAREPRAVPGGRTRVGGSLPRGL